MQAMRAFRVAGLIDEKGAWSGGDTVCVQVSKTATAASSNRYGWDLRDHLQGIGHAPAVHAEVKGSPEMLDNLSWMDCTVRPLLVSAGDSRWR